MQRGVRNAVVNSSKCCNTADIIDYDMDACIAQSCSVSWDEYEAASKIVRLVSAPFAVGKSWGARAWTNGPALELDVYLLSVVRHSC